MFDPVVGIVSPEDVKFGERFREDYGDISGLVADIKERGIVQPLAVKELGEGKYLLLAGGRRMTAAKRMGLTEIPVRIYPANLTEMQARAIELAENIQRKDLSWDEELKLTEEIDTLYKAMYGEKTKRVSGNPEDVGWSQRDTANLLGRSRSSVSQDLELAKAVKELPELKGAKTKDEARKVLKKLAEQEALREVSEQLSKVEAKTPEDVLHKKVFDAYAVLDAFVGMAELPDASIDLIEVDPPYGIDLQDVKRTEQSASLKNTAEYNEVPRGEYPAFLDKLIKECSRLLKPNGWLLFWFAPEPWFDEVLKVMRKYGFKVKGLPALWVKPTGQTMQPEHYLGNQWEPFFYATKKHGRIVKPKGNVFTTKPVPSSRKTHPTERPIELMEEIIATFATVGSTVLVPFAGSGNSILAAFNLKMKGFGYDLTQEYKDRYALKVYASVPGRYRSHVSEN